MRRKSTIETEGDESMRVRCPRCKELTTWEENPWRPFCSERCKLTDLGKWAAEEYRIEGKKEEEEDEDEKELDRDESE